MNYNLINKIIERNRPLAALSSLPFVASNSGIPKVCWFNFYLEEEGDALQIFIDGVYIMDPDMKIFVQSSGIKITTTIGEYDDPELSESEYLSLLEEQLVCYDSNKMIELIKRAEIPPLLVTYNAVIRTLKRESSVIQLPR